MAVSPSPGRCHVDQLCEDWLNLARRADIAVDDEHGDLRPDVLDAITRTVSAAIWFGLTTGYLTLTSSYRIPRKNQQLPHPPQVPAHWLSWKQPGRMAETGARWQRLPSGFPQRAGADQDPHPGYRGYRAVDDERTVGAASLPAPVHAGPAPGA